MESIEAFFDGPYKVMKFAESLELKDCRHVAHCIIYSLNPFRASNYESKAYVSMHMRHDGHLGFPGGFINKDEAINIIGGLNRELAEEINLDEKHFVTEKDHHISCIDEERKLCFHSFTKEVSATDFKEIERNALHSDPINEVLGVIRVPLFTKKDGIKGFPTFLSNGFAGCAKQQLLNFLLNSKIMSYEEIKDCLSKSLLIK